MVLEAPGGRPMRLITPVFAACLLCFGVSIGHAEKRVALVVGNDRYPNLPADQQLQKAVNDARAVGDALTRLGFEVMRGENLTRQAFVAKVDDMSEKLSPGDTAFFFYAGHGIAINGGNYILPSDVPNLQTGQETRLAHAALAESDIVAELQQRGIRVAIMVLDACRDNPFRRPGIRSVGSERGLTRTEPARGVFSLYSAGIGQSALDRLNPADRNPNSIFTRVLVPKLAQPGLDLAALAIDVREEVGRLAATVGHDQSPAYYDETSGGRIYLAGLVAAPSTPPRPVDPCASAASASLSSRPTRPLCAAEEQRLKPKDAFRECEECPEMVVIPAGEFMMGSPPEEGEGGLFSGAANDERPQHGVRIPKPFAVGKFTVTVDQFAAFVKETHYDAGTKCFLGPSNEKVTGKDWIEKATNNWRNPGYKQTGSHPVACTNWHDAKAYVAWLARKTGAEYRLLTEAEWEHAARAGTTTPYYYGSDSTALCAYANILDQTAHDVWEKNHSPNSPHECSDGYAYTSPVGSFLPNQFGLFDMLGNVWQTVEDCAHKNYDGAPVNGSAWLSGDCSHRMRRGGSFYTMPADTFRFPGVRDDRVDDVGFRVARTLN
jgi:formylglycine-generating enzyme required for sulfatase activity